MVDALYAAAGAAGAASLLTIDPLRTTLSLIGAAVLLFIGVRTLRDAFRVRLGAEADYEVASPRRAFASRGGRRSASNPLTIASWAAVFAAASGVGAAGGPMLLVAGVGVGSLVLGHAAGHGHRGGRAARWASARCGSPTRSPASGSFSSAARWRCEPTKRRAG